MRLKYEAKNAWEFERENNKLEDVMNYSKGYMHFLDVGKTERTSAREIVRMAKENGYISIDEAMNNGKPVTYRWIKNWLPVRRYRQEIKFMQLIKIKQLLYL